MAVEIKVPSPGESITEVEIGSWFVRNGDHVEKDQEIGEIESEKATLPLIAEDSGEITILKEEGETVPVGTVVCSIDTGKTGKKPEKKETPDEKPEAEKTVKPEREKEKDESSSREQEIKAEAISEESAVKVAETPAETPQKEKVPEKEASVPGQERIKATPVARKMMEEEGLRVEDIINGLRKITSKDVAAVREAVTSMPRPGISGGENSRQEQRAKMSNLRRKLAGRLVAVKNETAMLTTFNEADMSNIIALRKKYQDIFVKTHGVKLGFMSFFTKAIALTLKEFPNVNSYIDGEELVTPEYCDIGIAVQTDKGLMVPVLRNAENQSLAEIEKNIIDLAGKARKFRISIEEMSGGTFTITNGGIFGSMLSTPIINPPQAAILGMHNIIERPVAIDGEVVIRPMMYLALSYDHRIIDGRDSVSFLVRVKKYIENPVSMLMSGLDPEVTLLEIG